MKVLENFKTCPVGWPRTSKTLERVLVEMTEPVDRHHNIQSQALNIAKLVKRSSRKGGKLIVGEPTETVNTHL
jgi:hypothetical protein